MLTFVLAPFRFHTGSGRGRVALLTFVLAPFRFHTGSGRGRVAVLTFVLAPFRFHTGSGRGRVAVLTFVLAPFRFHTGSGRGRMERERKHVGIPHAMVAQVSCFMLQRNDTEYIRAGTTTLAIRQFLHLIVGDGRSPPHRLLR